jgi:hypothetical protein
MNKMSKYNIKLLLVLVIQCIWISFQELAKKCRNLLYKCEVAKLGSKAGNQT